MPSRKRTTVHLDARLHRALRLRAKATDCTISEVVGEAVRQALSQEARNIQQAEALAPRRTISLRDVGARLKRRPRS
jgi:plasmid stability protein